MKQNALRNSFRTRCKWFAVIVPMLLAAAAFGAVPPRSQEQPGPIQAPASISSAGNDKVTVQFPNTPVADVLDIYERLIGKPLVRDSQIYRGPNITLMPPNAVTKVEASRLIESALLINGYLLLPGPDGSTKIVLNDPKVKLNPLREGIAVFTNPEQLPTGDAIAGYFMRLDFLMPDDAKALFETHFQLNTYGKISPIYAPPAILITENVSLIKQMIQLKPLVDVDATLTQPPVRTELVEIKYADAAQVAEIIQALVDNRAPNLPAAGGAGAKPPTATPQRPVAAQAARPAQGQQPGRPQQQPRQVLNQNQLLSINAQLIPDTRTNKILVVTQPGNFGYIRGLITELDQPLLLKAPLERPLRYIAAGDVLPVLVNVLSDNGDIPNQSNLPGARLPSQLGRAGQTAGSGLTPARTTSASRGGSFTNAPTSADSLPDQLTDPNDDTSPLSVFIGKTRIIADRQANTILVMGPPESYAKVTTVLDRLDRKPPQVYLATIIGQLELDSDNELGIDYLLHFSNVKSGLLDTGILGSVKDVSISDLAKAAVPGNGLTVFGAVTNNLDILARALEQTHHFKVLSRPVVYAANNKKAVISSGQQIPVPTEILTSYINNNTNPNFQTNIAYRDVVLKLEVVPLINSNKEITLRIAQVNDTVVGQQPLGSGTVTSPIIGTERMNTTVTIPNGHTVVLGGLITEGIQRTDSGVPYLRRIPLLGRAFQSTSDVRSRKELIIFIQPVVVTDECELNRTSFKEDTRTEVGGDAAEVFPENPLPVLPPATRYGVGRECVEPGKK